MYSGKLNAEIKGGKKVQGNCYFICVLEELSPSPPPPPKKKKKNLGIICQYGHLLHLPYIELLIDVIVDELA